VYIHVELMKATEGHDYQVRYQYRLHAKPGKEGAILGDAGSPNGRAYEMGVMEKLPTPAGSAGATQPSQPSAERFGPPPERMFSGSVDISRKELSALTGLPADKKNILLRVEPQVYDATAKEFVTPRLSHSEIIVVDTYADGKVSAVRPLADWFVSQFVDDQSARAAMEAVDELTQVDPKTEASVAFERVIFSSTISPEMRALAVKKLPSEYLDQPASIDVRFRTINDALRFLATTPGTPPELKAEIQKTVK
jgi:hypothetical protein